MNVGNLILWGFAATIILTTIMAGSKPLNLTRMDLPFMLGSMFTPNRNKAPWIGSLIHLLMSWIFAFIYGAAFESSGLHTWWFGLAIGFVYGPFVLTVGMLIINYYHPGWQTLSMVLLLRGSLNLQAFWRLIMEKALPLFRSLPTWSMAAFWGYFITKKLKIEATAQKASYQKPARQMA